MTNGFTFVGIIIFWHADLLFLIITCHTELLFVMLNGNGSHLNLKNPHNILKSVKAKYIYSSIFYIS